jgi:hypothetical protein
MHQILDISSVFRMKNLQDWLAVPKTGWHTVNIPN